MSMLFDEVRDLLSQGQRKEAIELLEKRELREEVFTSASKALRKKLRDKRAPKDLRFIRPLEVPNIAMGSGKSRVELEFQLELPDDDTQGESFGGIVFIPAPESAGYSIDQAEWSNTRFLDSRTQEEAKKSFQQITGNTPGGKAFETEHFLVGTTSIPRDGDNLSVKLTLSLDADSRVLEDLATAGEIRKNSMELTDRYTLMTGEEPARGSTDKALQAELKKRGLWVEGLDKLLVSVRDYWQPEWDEDTGEFPRMDRRVQRFRFAVPILVYRNSTLRLNIAMIMFSVLGYAPKCPGTLALDLGTTNSAACYCPPELSEMNELKCLRDGKAGTTIPTVINFTRYDESSFFRPDWWYKGGAPSDRPTVLAPTFRCKIGAEADLDAKTVGSKVVLAEDAKALSVLPLKQGQLHQISVNVDLEKDPTELWVPRSLPAEAFFHELFKKISRDPEIQFRPGNLIITYPTTYLKPEINRLRRAICRSYAVWGQASALHWEEHRGALSEKFMKSIEERIGLVMVDEATAATFFFVYRDLFKGPATPSAMAELYPTGANILLVDVGGGTIDAVLARVTATNEIPAAGVQQRACSFHFSILGRTGHRSFGGNNVTAAWAKVIKAVVAKEIQSSRGDPLEWPPPEGAFSEWYARNHKEIDDIFPTRTPGVVVGGSDWKKRLANLRALVTFAEYLKCLDFPHHDGEGIEGSVEMKAFCKGIGSDRRVTPSILEELKKYLPKAANEFIGEELDRCIKNINRMLDNRLEGSRTAHRTYVVGNGSQYQLVRDKLEAGLWLIPDLFPENDLFPTNDESEVRRIYFEEEGRKTSVACGAALLRHCCDKQPTIKVNWDKDLTDELPMTIIYSDLVNPRRVVFKEGDYFSDMAKRNPFPIPVRGIPDVGRHGGENNLTIRLQQKKPGDQPDPVSNRYPPFLEFAFPIPDNDTDIEIFYGENPDEPTGDDDFFLTATIGGTKQTFAGEPAWLTDGKGYSPLRDGNL